MRDCKYVAPELKWATLIMALYTAWYADISSNMSLLRSAVDHGVRMLGYERIKTEQLDTVENLLSGKDVFSSLPTRFGKSLVYQTLPFCTESLLRNRASPLHSPSISRSDVTIALPYVRSSSEAHRQRSESSVHFW